MSISVEDVRRSNFKYRYDYRKSTIAAQIISFLLLAFTSGILISNYLSPMKSSIWKTSYYTSEQRMKTIFLLLGILSFILAIVVLIKVPALKKSFICITENGVYGTAGKAFYFATQSFTIPADQITNVTQKGNSIIVESGGNNYRCAINDTYGALHQITALSKFNGSYKAENYEYSAFVDCPNCGEINSSKNNYCYNCNTYLHNSAEKNNDTNSWTCPKCGKVNQNYVGTCGCGEAKPK